ncbi:hypothetical protein L6164_023391 [Bauhinia variegata]|uniref:Uncharacterized protein n=1 Tax=Bauhinia variegata TaxID=167791 RepID=A0ACB9MII0_BAUVA|nr:hypothetical protein L6164_023391 [Bauhinia variegata]
MTQLRECLWGKRLLLAVDDFDTFQNWEIVKNCLEVAERGSSIILTAQKADITKIADCTYFPEQDAFSVSEAVRADLNLSEMESSDLPESVYEQYTWKSSTSFGSSYSRKQPETILEEDLIPGEWLARASEPQYTLKSSTSFGSSYRRKQPETILEEDLIPEEGHEDATVTNEETDSIIEGLAHAFEPQSPLTGDNFASDKDAEALRAAENQEVSGAEILGIDDQPEDSSDQDTFDFFSSLETIKVSHAFQLKELPQKLHSVRIVECHFLESLAAKLENQSFSLYELYMIDCGFLKDFVDEREEEADSLHLNQGPFQESHEML